MIGKLKGVVDSYGEDFVILDVQGVGLRGALFRPDLAADAKRGRGRFPRHRDPCPRGHDPALWFPLRCRARMVSPASDRSGGRLQGGPWPALRAGAGGPRYRHRHGRQDRHRPRPRGRATPRRPAHRRIGRTRPPPSRRSTPPSWPSPERWRIEPRLSPPPMPSRPWSISVTPRSRPPPPSPPR